MIDPRLLPRLGALATLAVLLLVNGCGPAKPPEPVALSEVPRVLHDTFRAAGVEVRQLAVTIVAAVEGKEWTKASVGMEALADHPALTARQRNDLARCLITINTQVAEAAAAGDVQAGQLRQLQRTDK
ncbi:MAG: hypothetical protein HS113_04125 [Verrucomicrobiales bacterium]|nr:hypothetical protein [Verrucomicrobiales bacterium]